MVIWIEQYCIIFTFIDQTNVIHVLDIFKIYKNLNFKKDFFRFLKIIAPFNTETKLNYP